MSESSLAMEGIASLQAAEMKRPHSSFPAIVLVLVVVIVICLWLRTSHSIASFLRLGLFSHRKPLRRYLGPLTPPLTIHPSKKKRLVKVCKCSQGGAHENFGYIGVCSETIQRPFQPCEHCSHLLRHQSKKLEAVGASLESPPDAGVISSERPSAFQANWSDLRSAATRPARPYAQTAAGSPRCLRRRSPRSRCPLRPCAVPE